MHGKWSMTRHRDNHNSNFIVCLISKVRLTKTWKNCVYKQWVKKLRTKNNVFRITMVFKMVLNVGVYRVGGKCSYWLLSYGDRWIFELLFVLRIELVLRISWMNAWRHLYSCLRGKIFLHFWQADPKSFSPLIALLSSGSVIIKVLLNNLKNIYIF